MEVAQGSRPETLSGCACGGDAGQARRNGAATCSSILSELHARGRGPVRLIVLLIDEIDPCARAPSGRSRRGSARSREALRRWPAPRAVRATARAEIKLLPLAPRMPRRCLGYKANAVKRILRAGPALRPIRGAASTRSIACSTTIKDHCTPRRQWKPAPAPTLCLIIRTHLHGRSRPGLRVGACSAKTLASSQQTPVPTTPAATARAQARRGVAAAGLAAAASRPRQPRVGSRSGGSAAPRSTRRSITQIDELGPSGFSKDRRTASRACVYNASDRPVVAALGEAGFCGKVDAEGEISGSKLLRTRSTSSGSSPSAPGWTRFRGNWAMQGRHSGACAVSGEER